MSDIANFLENLTRFGLEHFRRFYGQYRGNVVRNDDPEERGRIQAYVPAVGHKQADYPDVWIEPALQGAGADRGFFYPPEIGDSVWITFALGDARFPNLYFGGWFGAPKNETEVPKEFSYKNRYPQRRGIVTRAGHVLQFDDERGREAVRLVWHKPEDGDKSITDRTVSADRTKGKWGYFGFEPNGDVVISNQNGSLIHLDAVNGEAKIIDQNGNSITMSSDGIGVIDNNGNFVNLSNGSMTISCSSDILATSSSIGIKTGGIDIKAIKLGLMCPSIVLGSDAATSLVKHTPWSASWAVISAIAEALGQSLSVPPAAGLPVTGGVIAPFMKAFAVLARLFPSLSTGMVKAS